jgi:hypothetical protein
MSKIFDSDGREIGNLENGLFGGKFTGNLEDQDGNVIGSVSTGGVFDPAPNSSPGDQAVFNASGQRIGHINNGSGVFGGIYKGNVYSRGDKVGSVSHPNTNSGTLSDSNMDFLAIVMAIFFVIYILIIVGIPVAVVLHMLRNNDKYEQPLARKIMRAGILSTILALFCFIFTASTVIGKFFLIGTFVLWVLNIILLVMVPSIIQSRSR